MCVVSGGFLKAETDAGHFYLQDGFYLDSITFLHV